MFGEVSNWHSFIEALVDLLQGPSVRFWNHKVREQTNQQIGRAPNVGVLGAPVEFHWIDEIWDSEGYNPTEAICDGGPKAQREASKSL